MLIKSLPFFFWTCLVASIALASSSRSEQFNAGALLAAGKRSRQDRLLKVCIHSPIPPSLHQIKVDEDLDEALSLSLEELVCSFLGCAICLRETQNPYPILQLLPFRLIIGFFAQVRILARLQLPRGERRKEAATERASG